MTCISWVLGILCRYENLIIRKSLLWKSQKSSLYGSKRIAWTLAGNFSPEVAEDFQENGTEAAYAFCKAVIPCSQKLHWARNNDYLNKNIGGGLLESSTFIPCGYYFIVTAFLLCTFLSLIYMYIARSMYTFLCFSYLMIDYPGFADSAYDSCTVNLIIFLFV